MGLKTRQSIWRFFAGKPVERYTFFEICERLDLDWKEIVVMQALEDEEPDDLDNKLKRTTSESLANISEISSPPATIDDRHYGLKESSHYYCAQRAAEILQKDLKNLRLITCNLDNGCSLAAIHNGQVIDTATGFTPLEGLMIDYSSGSVDTNVLNEMMRQDNNPDEPSKQENGQESSLAKASGKSNDPKSVGSAIDTDNSRAKQALDIYIHRLRSCLGSMLMSLGGMDAIVFTSELSENSEIVRELICQSLGFLGLKLDLKQNEDDPVDSDIATKNSKVRVLVVNLQENFAIANP